MKRFNNIYITALSTTLLLSACNKQLDLKPHQSIEQSVAILTEQDVRITLTGAYNRAGLSDLYGGGVFLYPDLLATQTIISWHGTYQQLTQMSNQAIPIDNSFINGTWLDAYEVINQANNVLANLDKVTAGDKDEIEGEAKFLRGLTYFDMARLFGRAWNDGDPNTNLAVPIVLTPTTVITAASYVSRSTVAQVYQQAIDDLTTAEAKLAGSSGASYGSQYGAAAILARLYLQQGDYSRALAEASRVIESGKYSLNTNYADEFPYLNQTASHIDNTDEDIFALQVNDQQGVNSLNTYYASKSDGGRGDIHVDDSFLATFEPGDDRANIIQYDDPDDNTTTLRCHKFDNADGNVHIVRLAEMYLIRAECNFRLGSATGATPVNDINVIRERAQLGDLATVTLDQILNERVHELFFEGGFFLHDAKRLNTAGNPVTVGALPASSPKLVLPIPKQELNANPKLVQNPGYGG